MLQQQYHYTGIINAKGQINYVSAIGSTFKHRSSGIDLYLFGVDGLGCYMEGSEDKKNGQSGGRIRLFV